MAKKSKSKEEIENIRKLADVNEAYLVGLLWNNPTENYSLYGNKLESSDFLHRQWGFYFGLGKKLYEKGLKKFDDISVNATVEEFGIRDLFDEYGGVETMYDLTNIVKENPINVESYFGFALKNKIIMNLVSLIGVKVIQDDGKYSYKEMSALEIAKYWQDRMNALAVDSTVSYDEENLYLPVDDFIDNLREQAGNIIPYHSSHILNRVVRGIPRGEVTMIGGFGNSGKSSFVVDKVLMAFLKDVDKTLIVLNEEGADKLRIKLLLSLINHEMRDRDNPVSFPRWKFNDIEKITAEENEILVKAFEKLSELMDGDEAKIKVVFMEQYTIRDLKNIVALHANRGYVNLIIDTHKVPDGYSTSSRWEAIVEATKEIYKFTRPESGGFNLRTVLTIQLADSHINDRFLGFDSIGEGKAMKNEASVLLMFRPLFTDEYDKLKPVRWVKSDLSPDKKYLKEPIELDKEKTYYVMFMPKNRFGGNTDSGQDCILLEPNFDFNSFREIGEVKIPRNYA